MIGAEGTACVERPFAANPAFLDMLAAATGRPALLSGAATGTSLGTALLMLPPPAEAPRPSETAHVPGVAPARLTTHAARWRERV
jgi:hypothetical protein